MAVWWSAWVVLVAWAGVCVGVSRQEWGGCGPVVCEEVVKQAQGLARLRLLRNYVSQAMELLDQTMDSIEDDVVRSGQSLSQFIGGQCSSAHTILRQITQDLDDDDHQDLNHASQSRILTSTSHSSTSQTSGYQRPSTTQQSTHGGYTLGTDDDDDDNWPDINERESDGDSYDVEHSSAEASQDLQTSSSISSTSNYRLTNKFDSTDDQDSREDYTTRGYKRGPLIATSSSTTTWRTGTGTGGSGYGYGGADRDRRVEHGHWSGDNSDLVTRPGGRGHGHRGSHNRGRGSQHGGRSFSHRGRGSHHGGREEGGVFGVGCRGVEPGNPNWVPGLDDWCAANCAAGYCPLDKCVC